MFLFCKFKPSVFQVPSCCSIWLSSWISAGTAEQLSASAQACTDQHNEPHSGSGQSTKCCSRVLQQQEGATAQPSAWPACVRQPFTPACYSLRAWSGRIPRAFCILSLLLLLFHIVAADGWRWLTTTTKSSSSRKHSAFMRSLQLGDILIQSTPSGPLDL